MLAWGGCSPCPRAEARWATRRRLYNAPSERRCQTSARASLSGQLYAFGLNNFGQLGSEAFEPITVPTSLLLPGASGPVTEVATGFYDTLALTSTGQLYAFGANLYGQLGTTTHVGTQEPTQPTQVTLPGASGRITQMAAGEAHSLVLTAGGQLYAFGSNAYGQLGRNESEPNPMNPTPGLVTLPGARGPVTRISAGWYFSLALTAAGQLFSFGENEYGQLGRTTPPETFEANATPAQVAFPEGASIDTISHGPAAFHALAVIANLALTTSSLPEGVLGVPYSAQLQASGGAVPYSWSASGLPPGLSINPASGAVSGTPTAAGSYAATFTVTDADGINASARLAIAIGAPAPLSSSTARTALAAPAISAAHQSASRWREGNKLARISRKLPVGTTFSFFLNEQASVGFRFNQTLPGRRVGRKCLARTHANRRRRACKRTVTAGTLSFAGHLGMNKLVFQGRISRSKKLRPGRYTLTITATNSAGARSAPASLSFTIVG